MKANCLLSVAVAASWFGTVSASAITITENFSSSPATTGWQVAGDGSLFQWNATNQNLEVTWDSARQNSYFHRPIGITLTKAQDFNLSFAMRLQSASYYTNKPNGFQIAIGLIHLQQATNATFLRGTGFNSPNLVEFDYFPPSIYDPTVSPTFISAAHEFASSFNFPYHLPLNQLVEVSMSYTASNKTLVTTVQADGQPLGPVGQVVLGSGFSDFAVDTLAISSYSDAGQYPDYAGSVLAQGTVSSFSLLVPGSPIASFTANRSGSNWHTTFKGDANWVYTLQRTADFQSWSDVTSTNLAQAQQVTLSDTASPGTAGFYRISAQPAP